MTFRTAGVAGLLLMLAANSVHADPAECQDAINSYNRAISDISDALRRYTSCVTDSRGHDDCSSEFRRLRSAQDDFETAVSSYESDCQ